MTENLVVDMNESDPVEPTGTITVELRGLSGNLKVEMPAGSSIADIRNTGTAINEGAVVRLAGQAVVDEEATTLTDGDVLVVTPPAAKHGA